MWAAALVALAVGGPLGACLFLAAGVTHVLKVGKVDAEYAKRGELPPTARLVEKWLDRQKAAGKAPADAKVKPYGSRAYARQRWLAFWEDLGEKHRADRAAHKAAVAEAKRTGTPPPAKSSLKDRIAGWKWSISSLTEPVGSKPDNKPTPAVDPEPVKADGPRIACPECGATLADTTGGWQHPADSTCPEAKPAPQQPATTAAQDDPALRLAAQLADTRRRYPMPEGVCPRCQNTATIIASGWCEPCTTSSPHGFCPDCRGASRLDPDGVWRHGNHWPCRTEESAAGHTTACSGGCGRQLPIHPTAVELGMRARCNTCSQPGPTQPATNNEGDDMTAPANQRSGEVTGIPSAVHYLNQMAAAHQQHADNEAMVASLAGFSVGADDLALVQAALAASQGAADLYRDAAKTINDGNAAVRQGYASAPSAADKRAQMAE
jgi:hypothetical protein